MDEKRNPIKNIISGALIVDKPIGMTSHQVVQEIRKGTRTKRAGHTGTLDPRASGVLVVLLGPAVRLSQYISAADKRYQANIKLGEKTDTYDREGKITGTSDVDVTYEQLVESLKTFVGEIEQVPPPYSAVKVKGKHAYDLARKGEEVILPPRLINMYSIDLLEWASPEAVVDVHCSSGTYIRSLAYDLGELLGCGALLTGLRRTKSGRFSLREAIPLRKLQQAFESNTWYEYLIPAAEALSDWDSITLTNEEVESVKHGISIPRDEGFENMVRAITEQGELVSLMEYDPENNMYKPRKVFFS
jgi:tRNA pseudouridine55 synthase